MYKRSGLGFIGMDYPVDFNGQQGTGNVNPAVIHYVDGALQDILADNLALAGENDSNQYVNMANAGAEFLSILNPTDGTNYPKINAAANLIARKYLTAKYGASPMNCLAKVSNSPTKTAAVHCAQFAAIVNGPGLDFVNIAMNNGTGLSYSPSYSGSFPTPQAQGAGSRTGISPGDASTAAYPGAITPATQAVIDAQVAGYSKTACGSPSANNTVSYDSASGATTPNCKWFVPLPVGYSDYMALQDPIFLAKNHAQALALQGNAPDFTIQSAIQPQYSTTYVPPVYQTFQGTTPTPAAQTSGAVVPLTAPQIQTSSGQNPAPAVPYSYPSAGSVQSLVTGTPSASQYATSSIPQTASSTLSSLVPSGGTIDNAMSWVNANPLTAAAIVAGLFFMFGGMGGRR